MAIVAPEGLHLGGRRASAEVGASGVLARLLADAVRVEPDRVAFRDGPGRHAWTGRPCYELNCAIASEAVRRLAAYLGELALGAGARVGICLPNGSEAAMALLAVGEAGLVPCLLDATASAGELSGAIEAGDVRAVITQARLGTDKLAEKLCFVAAGFYRLRFLLAFGPNVPDGVVDLDPILLEPRASRTFPAWPDDGTLPGIVTFARCPSNRRPAARSYRSLIAAAVPIVAAARLKPGERLLTFFPPDDLKGLATGIVAGLVAGATVEAHLAFESRALADAVSNEQPTHVVLPGWMEASLEALEPGPGLRSIVLVHEPPLRLKAREGASARIVDVVCCGELGLLSSVRRRGDEISFTDLCTAGKSGPDTALVEACLSDRNEICLRGAAVGEGGVSVQTLEEWLPSGLVLDARASEIVALR